MGIIWDLWKMIWIYLQTSEIIWNYRIYFDLWDLFGIYRSYLGFIEFIGIYRVYWIHLRYAGFKELRILLDLFVIYERKLRFLG